MLPSFIHRMLHTLYTYIDETSLQFTQNSGLSSEHARVSSVCHDHVNVVNVTDYIIYTIGFC